VLTVGAACASSLVAVGEALSLIEDEVCDLVVVGGVEALHPFIYRGFHALKALSAKPAAPFDARRSGLSLGEAGVVLVLESPSRALAAGRAPLAFVEGYGSATDGFDQTAPDPGGVGLVRACHRALTTAGLSAAQVDRYHAHGTGTTQNDRMEAAAHAVLFEGRAVPICAIKGSTGHTLGASGALETAVCALTLEQGWLPPVCNLREVDVALWPGEVPLVREQATRHEGEVALVASAGFGGINAALVLRRGDRG
jgi:3-oxoacyl-[acyl-carrier-protein] synthase II